MAPPTHGAPTDPMNESPPDLAPEPGAPTLAVAAETPRTTPVRTFAAAILRCARPKQWVKNLLVIAAPGAAGVLLRPAVLGRTALAFLVLCLLASAAYLVNDVIDAEADRHHPRKRERPVAAGQLGPRAALVTAGVLATAGLAVGQLLGARFLLVACTYVAVTLAYSLGLKRVDVIDIAVVASCYVLRALAGAAATDVRLSPWFLILTTSVALLVVSGKRAADRVALERNGNGRPNGNGPDYPLPYLRFLWMVASGIAIAAYSSWAFAVPHVVDGIAWSQVSIVPFALGVLRYGLVIERGGGGSPEDVLLHDPALQTIALVWLVVYALGVYLT